MTTAEERKPRYFVLTFGCQMNVNDSERLAGLLESEGFEPAASQDEADFVFVNTCAVREKAAEKLFSTLGRLKLQKDARPGMTIGVGGCVAQLQGTAILDRAPHVDVLVGTHNLAHVPALARQVVPERPGVDLDRKADSFAIPHAVVAHSNPVRAYVTVMEGCNRVCSFCVVPRTRGPEVCRAPDAILDEVRALVARGFAEVMLLGQTVNAYCCAGVDFPGLLARIDDVSGLKRLRFTTSHPCEVTPAMAAAFRDLPRLCPYLHLPVQSGSDRVLSDMRRGYSRSRFVETIAVLRESRPDIAISSDVIVGYPGETDADFLATQGLVEEVGFEGLFVFTYSPRPGTTATGRADDVDEKEKLRRLHVLNGAQQARQRRRNATLVGSRQSVLVESGSGGRLSGRTPHFRIVHFDGPAALLGREVEVEITASGPNALVGVACQAVADAGGTRMSLGLAGA